MNIKRNKHTMYTVAAALVMLAGLLGCSPSGEVASSLITHEQEVWYVPESDVMVSGYGRKIEGSDFRYGTAVPGVQEAMIVRATDGNWTMNWETAPVPSDIGDGMVSFVWAANLNARDDGVEMELTVADSERYVFALTQADHWVVDGDQGGRLMYIESVRAAGVNSYGFMVLRLPAERVRAGEPLRLQVRGSEAGSNAWYMTVKTDVSPRLTLTSRHALLERDGQMMQPLAVEMLYFGRPGQARLHDGAGIDERVDVDFGYNLLYAFNPQVSRAQSREVTADLPQGSLSTTAVLEPVRQWRMHIVQNTHTDIGYTRPQTEIMSDLIRHLDLALDYMDDTDHLPEEAQFRWTAEITWAVNQFLKNRPQEQIDRLRQRVNEGRMELAAMYLNFDELPDEQALARSVMPVDHLRSLGMEMSLAMQNDINGIAWAMNDYFNSLGIKYLHMGTHGHKALIPFDHPTPFWWESPSGNRMLAFRGEHYHFGNTRLRIHHQDFEAFENELLRYLSELEALGYPHDIAMVQHSGYLTDNSPPSILASDLIRTWNEKYEWPQLRFSVASDFMEEIETHYADELPVYRGAWPDWWVDGFGSGAREMWATRQGHVDIIAGQGVLSMSMLKGNDLPEHSVAQMELANDALLFYGEHTFGSHASVRDPLGLETKEMRRHKESFAWEASRRSKLIQEDGLGFLQAHISKLDEPNIVIFNTYPAVRSGVVESFVEAEVVPAGSHIQLRDAGGKIYPAQLLRNIHGGSYWAFRVEELPPFGYKQFVIEFIDRPTQRQTRSLEQAVLENQWYRIEADTDAATLTSFTDRDLDVELIDQSADWAFGQFIYEQLADRNQLDQFYLDDYTHHKLETVRYNGIQRGPIWDTMHFTGSTMAAEGRDGFQLQIRLYHYEKMVEFRYRIRKKPIVDPESIYIAFPFAVPDGTIHFDVPGGMLQAGVDQIPGSSNDWNMVQNVVSVRNNDLAVAFAGHEAPLMQLGNINTGRFVAGAEPEHTHVYGWPLNNYWVTNFNADQKGEIEWTYKITSGTDLTNSAAMQFAWNQRLPLLPRIFPRSLQPTGEPVMSSMLSPLPNNVYMVTLMPHNNRTNLFLHVREMDGRNTAFTPDFADLQSLEWVDNDVNGNRRGEVQQGAIELRPYESRFIEIILP